MIKFENVSKQYERNGITTQALQNINLTIQKGDIYGIIGYSGAGKSTLVRLINFLEKPTQGNVIVLKLIATLKSYQEAKNNVLALPGLWPMIPIFYFVMKLHQHSIRKPRNQFWN